MVFLRAAPLIMPLSLSFSLRLGASARDICRVLSAVAAYGGPEGGGWEFEIKP